MNIKSNIPLVVLLISLSCCTKQRPIPSEKCNASDYKQVTIGTQVWMAENYRCSKYDTESEPYKAGIKEVGENIRNCHSTPYFIDATDNNNWRSWEFSDIRETAENLSEEQIDDLGYLYNWYAVAGINDSNDTIQVNNHQNLRQGICPNGWHIPSKAEWDILLNYIGGTNAANKLKATYGWFSRSEYEFEGESNEGTDDFDFSSLPAGCAGSSYNNGIIDIGRTAFFWMSNLNENTPNIMYLNNYSNDISYMSSNICDGGSLRCIKNSGIEIEPSATHSVDWYGGNFSLYLKAEQPWTIISNKEWISFSKTSGYGSDTILVNVAESPEYNIADTAIINILKNNGVGETLELIRKYKPYPEKCDASLYSQVTIGTQVWMAENYRCSKYDTQSEAYFNGISTISVEALSDTLNYIDASKDVWKNYDSDSESPLTEKQIAKFGYLYNWLAAVGLPNTSVMDSIVLFVGNRQGICPNGWHIPSDLDWQILLNNIGGTDNSGPKLKAILGWDDFLQYYDDDAYIIRNNDKFSFNALPAGYGNNSYNYSENTYFIKRNDIGSSSYFWSSTRKTDDENENQYYGPTYYYLSNSSEKNELIKSFGDTYDYHTLYSIRCVKN